MKLMLQLENRLRKAAKNSTVKVTFNIKGTEKAAAAVDNKDA